MNRMLALPVLLFAFFTAFHADTATAAKPCGKYTDEKNVTWKIATTRSTCEQARQTTAEYLYFQNAREQWASPVTIDGYECAPSSHLGIYCSGWYRRGLWLIVPGARVPIRQLHVPPPRLSYATGYMGQAISRKYKNWRYGYAKRIKCKRLGRLRQHCRASWLIGDMEYSHSARLRMVPHRNVSPIIVRGKTRTFNEYCAIQDRPKCVRQRRFGPIVIRDRNAYPYG